MATHTHKHTHTVTYVRKSCRLLSAVCISTCYFRSCCWCQHCNTNSLYTRLITLFYFFFFDGATARGGPWHPLQYASKPLDPLLWLSIRLFQSFSGPWTRHPAISFLVFLFVLLHTAFRTSFLELRCVAFFLYDQAIVFFDIL